MSHKFHGIQLALNSKFANLVIEHLAVDPLSTDAIPLVAGRSWYNTAQKAYKYCDVDSGGALRVNTFGSAEALAAAVSAINTSITNLGDTANTAIAAEATRALAAEAALAADLATEASARIAGDAAEATARIAADAVVAADAAAANVADAANATTALGAEASVREAADLALGVRIDTTQAEVDLMEVSLGLNSDGTYTAPANTTYLGAVTTQKGADIALDAAITAEVARSTNQASILGAALTAEETARIAADTSLQTQLTAYVNAAVTDNANADASEAAARIAADTAQQAEIDAIEVASGLELNGTLAVIADTNYINAAPSLLAASKLLDTAVKANEVAIAAETVARTDADLAHDAAIAAEVLARTTADNAHQTELDAIETAAGLNGDGTYAQPVGSNYIGSTTTLAGADMALDAAIKVNANEINAINTSAIPNLQTQITDEVTRALAAEAGITAATTASVNTLTTNLAAEVTRATAAEGVLTTNLAGEVTRATAAEADLQAQVSALAASAGDGAVALTASLNAKRYTYMSSAPALVHTVTHNLGTQFYSANIMVKGSDGIWRNDIMPVQDVDLNSYTITLTESSDVKASGQSNAAL